MKQNRNELIFLTVGNNRQKALYEKLLSNSAMCRDSNVIVISDGDSGRIGSGGAVLNIIAEYFTPETKLLIINSGGFSKRCINYAIRGKAFTDIVYNHEITTLFDAIIDKAKTLMSRFSSGALVCCGDILVDTDNSDIVFDNNIGFCAKSNSTVGSRHGVMFGNASGEMTHFLHKAPASVLDKFCENNNYSYVPVDTGMVFLSGDFCQAAQKLEKQNHITDLLKDKNTELNFYSDIVVLFASELTEQQYLSSATDENSLHLRRLLHTSFSSFRMKLISLESSCFLHFGTLQETVDNIFALSSGTDNYLSISSFSDTTTQIGNHTVLNNTILENNCKVGCNCLVTDISLTDVCIPDNSSVCGIKLLNGSYVAIVCDINENPKDLCGNSTLWDMPRFYKGISFSDSYNKFITGQGDEALSLAECVENADYNYFFERKQIVSDFSSHLYRKTYTSYREEIIADYFSGHTPYCELSCNKDKVQLDLPVRINLSGTWSDAMPYCVENGGQVVNIAVKVNGSLPIKILAERRDDSNIVFESDDKSIIYDFASSALFDDFSDFILHKAVLDVVGINSNTQLPCGFTLSVNVNQIDKGSGLGTSSILLGGCVAAISELFGLSCTYDDIVKMVFVAEQLMKTGGGWQDQIGGLLPGIKISTTSEGIEQIPRIHNIEASDKFKAFVKEKFVLIPTGQRHFGRFIVTDVVNRYLDNYPDVRLAYKEIIDLNNIVANAIENNNFELLRSCLNKHFSLLKKISPETTNQNIDMLVDKCAPFIDGASVCGAGGGGYLLAILRNDTNINKLQDYMTKAFPGITSPVLNIDISFDRMLKI